MLPNTFRWVLSLTLPPVSPAAWQMSRPAKPNGAHAALPANGSHGVEVLPYRGEVRPLPCLPALAALQLSDSRACLSCDGGPSCPNPNWIPWGTTACLSACPAWFSERPCPACCHQPQALLACRSHPHGGLQDEDPEAGPHAGSGALEAAGDRGHIGAAGVAQAGAGPADWSLQRPSGISERVITADGSYHSRDSSYRGHREGSYGAGGMGAGASQLMYSQRSQSLGAASAAVFAAAASGMLPEGEEEGSEEEVAMPAGAAQAAAAAAVGARDLQSPAPPPPRLLAGRTRGQYGSSSSLAAEAGDEPARAESTPPQQQLRVPPLGRLPPVMAPPPAPASLGEFDLQSPRPPGSR